MASQPPFAVAYSPTSSGMQSSMIGSGLAGNMISNASNLIGGNMMTSSSNMLGGTSMANGASVMGGSNLVTGTNTISSQITGSHSMGERVQSTRKVSSTIVAEQYLGALPNDMPVREVEVQGPIQEVVTHVPKKQVIEIEKKVPKIEYEWVEKIVEVPRIEVVDRQVEVPRYQEVIREVKVPQIIDQPREVIREVKVPKINYVEQVKEVPGQIIEVPKPYTVEEQVQVTRYNDKSVPLVVAQTIKPYIIEGTGTVDIDVIAYEPECVPVDIHVLKPIQAQIQASGAVETMHRVITVPAAQYNTMLQQLNAHLTQIEIQKLPYLQSAAGRVEFLGDKVQYTQIPANCVIQGFDSSRNNVHTHIGERVNLATGQTLGGASTTTITQTSSAYPIYQGAMHGAAGSYGTYQGGSNAYSASNAYTTGAQYQGGYTQQYNYSGSSSPVTKQTTTTTTTTTSGARNALAQPIMA